MKKLRALTIAFIMVTMLLVPFTAYAVEAPSPEYNPPGPPTPPPTPPTPPETPPEVLGAAREQTVLGAVRDQVVLGANRSPLTGENSPAVIWFIAAGAGVVAVWSGKKLIEE